MRDCVTAAMVKVDMLLLLLLLPRWLRWRLLLLLQPRWLLWLPVWKHICAAVTVAVTTTVNI